MSGSRGAATRDRLLDAAAAVLLDAGPHGLTLDAVAARARVSKGGLLYHFPSKASLLDALVDRWNERFETDIEAAADDRPGGWVRAYLAASEVNAEPAARQTETGLVAAIAADPARLERVRERYADWQRRIVDDGIDPVDATVVRLAADGLWFAELLALAAPEGDLREAVLRRLGELTQP